jgi:hypothetical protein
MAFKRVEYLDFMNAHGRSIDLSAQATGLVFWVYQALKKFCSVAIRHMKPCTS